MNIAEAILSRGADSAHAILYKDSALTYHGLRHNVTRLAAILLTQGYLKGDRIGIVSENSLFFVISYLAIIRAGMVAVPLQTEITETMFSEISTSTAMRAVFVSNRFLKRLCPWAHDSGLSIMDEGHVADSPSNGEAFPFPNISPTEDLATLLFTSGSTGRPKGVMVTHRNIECNTLDIISYIGLTSTDRAMVVLPFHYCFGLSLLHTHLWAGASLVLNNEFKLFPEAMLTEMEKNSCTGLAGVPSTYQILLRKSRFPGMALPRLRWLQQAGGKLPNPFICELLDAFPHAKFYLMYGQTEATARLSYLPPERLADKLGSIGKGLPSTQLEVLKPDGTPVKPGSDEIGEIVAQGHNIAKGYWGDPDETSRFFKNGRLHTGDIATVDSDGFIFIVERARDMIKSGGNRVSAKEIEEIIAEIPEVVEAAVLGVPHELLGEAIKAFVLLRADSPLRPAEIQAHCRKRLPAFKVPEEVILVKSMVHNSSGKILKHELKKLLEPVRESKAHAQPQASTEVCSA